MMPLVLERAIMALARSRGTRFSKQALEEEFGDGWAIRAGQEGNGYVDLTLRCRIIERSSSIR